MAGGLGVRSPPAITSARPRRSKQPRRTGGAFVPSPDLDDPYLAVSADVVVGPDDESAPSLAAGYGLWVRNIRKGEGAIRFPGPAERDGYVGRERPHARGGSSRPEFVGSPGRWHAN